MEQFGKLLLEEEGPYSCDELLHWCCQAGGQASSSEQGYHAHDLPFSCQVPNAVSLRQLSMLMRQMGDTPQERTANIKVGAPLFIHCSPTAPACWAHCPSPPQESVAKAKEAVAVDVTDPESWCAWWRSQIHDVRTRSPCWFRHADILGNAYLATFFSCDHKPEDLASAMKAYARAVRL